MSTYKPVILALVVVGAVNWGLVGLLGINIVSTVLGTNSVLEKVVYVLIGLSGALVAWDKWGGSRKK